MDFVAVLGLYLGGFIGAGFASGAEICLFFVRYGRAGLVGVAAALVSSFAGAVFVLEVCARRQIRSYGEFATLAGASLAAVWSWAHTFFLLVSVAIMLAGAGALAGPDFTRHALKICTALLCLASLRQGVRPALKAGGSVAGILVLFLVVFSVTQFRPSGSLLPASSLWAGAEAGLLYASYNLFFSSALLASVHQFLPTKGARWALAGLAHSILAVCLVPLFFILSAKCGPEAPGNSSALPLLELCRGIGPWLFATYRLILWAALYTTAVANSLSIVKNVTSISGQNWAATSTWVIVIATALSYVGFTRLLHLAYPVIGLLGLVLFGILAAAQRP